MQFDQEQLLDYLEGELPPDQAARVEAALAEDPKLARLIEQLRADRDALRTLGQENAPPIVDDVMGGVERQMLLGDDLDQPDGSKRPTKPSAKHAGQHRRITLGRMVSYSAAAATLALAGAVVAVMVFDAPLLETARQWNNPDASAPTTHQSPDLQGTDLAKLPSEESAQAGQSANQAQSSSEATSNTPNHADHATSPEGPITQRLRSDNPSPGGAPTKRANQPRSFTAPLTDQLASGHANNPNPSFSPSTPRSRAADQTDVESESAALTTDVYMDQKRANAQTANQPTPEAEPTSVPQLRIVSNDLEATRVDLNQWLSQNQARLIRQTPSGPSHERTLREENSDRLVASTGSKADRQTPSPLSAKPKANPRSTQYTVVLNEAQVPQLIRYLNTRGPAGQQEARLIHHDRPPLSDSPRPGLAAGQSQAPTSDHPPSQSPSAQSVAESRLDARAFSPSQRKPGQPGHPTTNIPDHASPAPPSTSAQTANAPAKAKWYDYPHYLEQYRANESEGNELFTKRERVMLPLIITGPSQSVDEPQP